MWAFFNTHSDFYTEKTAEPFETVYYWENNKLGQISDLKFHNM